MGYGPSLFWELSLGEVSDLIESYARVKEREKKEKEEMVKQEIILLFNQAVQTSDFISKTLGNKEPIKELSVYYPELFRQEEPNEAVVSVDLELHKARMENYAHYHNMSRKRGEHSGRNDSRKATSNH